jgi:hypothetical protein
MKKISVHLIIFSTFFIHISNNQAAEVDYFDFDDYEARMASMTEADREDGNKVNTLLAPLDVPLRNPRDLDDYSSDDDSILERVMAESIETAQREEERRTQEAQRGLNAILEEKPIAQDSPIPPSQPAEWEPLDAHIIQAGELVMALKRGKNGANPTHGEMAAHLVANMGITAAQAEKILEQLMIGNYQ